MSMFKDFVIPTSVEEARAALKQLGPEGVPLAGATSCLFLRHKEPKVAVDLSRAGLGGIREAGGVFAIGAMSTVDALRRHRAPGWVLDRVAARFVTQQVRNISTLGGNVARVFAWADFPVALLALEASLTVQGDAVRAYAASEFFDGQPARRLNVGDLLTEIRVPALRPGLGFGYHKQVRVSADFSQATAAAVVELRENYLARVRVALGAAVPMPLRLTEVENALVGTRWSAATVRAACAEIRARTWRSVAGFAPDYIEHVAKVAVGDALVQACTEAAAGGAA